MGSIEPPANSNRVAAEAAAAVAAAVGRRWLLCCSELTCHLSDWGARKHAHVVHSNLRRTTTLRRSGAVCVSVCVCMHSHSQFAKSPHVHTHTHSANNT